jgi:hypothetical protein
VHKVCLGGQAEELAGLFGIAVNDTSAVEVTANGTAMWNGIMHLNVTTCSLEEELDNVRVIYY